MSRLKSLGVWLRAGHPRFALLVLLVIVLQTAAFILFEGTVAMVAGAVVLVTLILLVGAYASGSGGS